MKIKVALRGLTYSIRQSAYGNWYGYVGRYRVEAFSNSIPGYGMQQEAERWLEEKCADAIIPRNDKEVRELLRHVIKHLDGHDTLSVVAHAIFDSVFNLPTRANRNTLRLIGALDARAGKGIDCFYLIKGLRLNESRRAEYEIGYRAEKALMLSEKGNK